MKAFLSDKRTYFVAFGAAGGLLSAVIYHLIDPEAALHTWLIGMGATGMMTSILLAFAQGRYSGVGMNIADLKRAVYAGGGGGAVGSAAAYNIAFPLANFLGVSADVGRFIGWGLSGVAVGFVVSKTVPNLNSKLACVAGGVGALLGCGLMYMMDSLFQAGGLTVGMVTTGAAIGFVIAYAESAFRNAWLEVTIRPKGFSLEKERTLTMTLGDKPILFGCASDADVKLAEVDGAKSQFATVSLTGGKVHLHDMINGVRRSLDVDSGFDLSNAHIVVRSKLSASVAV